MEMATMNGYDQTKKYVRRMSVGRLLEHSDSIDGPWDKVDLTKISDFDEFWFCFYKNVHGNLSWLDETLGG